VPLPLPQLRLRLPPLLRRAPVILLACIWACSHPVVQRRKLQPHRAHQDAGSSTNFDRPSAGNSAVFASGPTSQNAGNQHEGQRARDCAVHL
jgi:hypothetical protein